MTLRALKLASKRDLSADLVSASSLALFDIVDQVATWAYICMHLYLEEAIVPWTAFAAAVVQLLLLLHLHLHLLVILFCRLHLSLHLGMCWPVLCWV